MLMRPSPAVCRLRPSVRPSRPNRPKYRLAAYSVWLVTGMPRVTPSESLPHRFTSKTDNQFGTLEGSAGAGAQFRPPKQQAALRGYIAKYTTADVRFEKGGLFSTTPVHIKGCH